jgi:hypothetical protein
MYYVRQLVTSLHFRRTITTTTTNSNSSSSTMSARFTTEKQFAVAAVRRACGLTSILFDNLVKGETLTKDDKTPVTGKQQN